MTMAKTIIIRLLATCCVVPLAACTSNVIQKAYKAGEVASAHTLLSEWAKAPPPRTDAELSSYSDWKMNAYLIFEDFYPKLCNVTNTSFVLFQPTLHVYYDNRRSNQDAAIQYDISDFRPLLRSTPAIPVMLTEERRRLLLEFFASATNALSTDAGQEDYRKEREHRIRFLSPLLYIDPAVYWERWISISPYVVQIYLDQPMRHAFVEFGKDYREGRATYWRKNDKWELINVGYGAIE